MIVFVPRNGGYWRNGFAMGEGDYSDDKQCLIKKGVFEKNKLNGEACVKLDYSKNLVNVRVGSFVLDKEQGEIHEYVFAKTLWDDFLNAGAACTRYTHVFDDGKWKSTTETKNDLMIKGTLAKQDDRFKGFEFAEL